MSDLIATPNPSHGQCQALTDLFPENPFYQTAYVDYRRSQGFSPWLLTILQDGQLDSGCTAFSKKGRVSGTLEIPSFPVLKDSPKFWDDLVRFSKEQGFTQLSINSFASERMDIPDGDLEFQERSRDEYVLDLQHPDLWKGIRKGHLSNIKKAQKAGLQVKCVVEREACAAHAGLIQESMIRRRERGEQVSTDIDEEGLFLIIKSGSGKLFQAMRENQVMSSNLLLMADHGAYNQTQGTSPEGMSLGAAHYLIYEIGNMLRQESFKTFNLGGTDQSNVGLERFKSGFGVASRKVELHAVEIFVGNKVLRQFKKLVGCGV